METVEHILQARKDLKETCLGFGKNGAGDEDDEYYYGKRIDDNYLWLAAEFRHGRKMKENRCKKKASLKILAQLALWRVLGIDKCGSATPRRSQAHATKRNDRKTKPKGAAERSRPR